MEFLARRYDTSEAVRIKLADGVIASIEPAATSDKLPFVAPAMFDLQVNGYGGVWFSDEKLTVDGALTALYAYYAHGVTRLCPTLITNST